MPGYGPDRLLERELVEVSIVSAFAHCSRQAKLGDCHRLPTGHDREVEVLKGVRYGSTIHVACLLVGIAMNETVPEVERICGHFPCWTLVPPLKLRTAKKR
ncbi:hypothetical protein ACFLST_00460 [Chloroflexota bacterium]